ncbi:hypothetical protein HYX11_05100 [Candidatus Woesearchaeota archaeon]|nr:hypothetical protein [Candidatus Woesearchaeota archaeon]
MEEDSKQLDRFIQAIEESFSGLNPKTFWPLNGGQIDAYFDVDEALDMYYRLNKLKEKLSIKEIADLMPQADIIRIFLEHNAIIGLKVAKKLGIADISVEDRIKYTLFLFELLKHKVKNDIFCLDGKNLILDEKEVSKFLKETNWNKPLSHEDKKKIAFFTVMTNNLCYTLYYDIFMTGGFYLHGPYDASGEFGEGAILLIRDYHDLNPKEIWPDLQIPYQKVKICAVYKNLDLKINFVNHPITKDSIGDKLIAYKIYLDYKEIEINKIDELIEIFHKVSSQQTKKINALSDLDKVRKGAEIAFYFFRKLRKYTGDDWTPLKEIEKTIEKFGEKFIKQFQYQEKPNMEHWKKIFDPRDDYY